MNRTLTRCAIRAAGNGTWIASVCFPKSLGDACHGWHSHRAASPAEAADWLGSVIKNHLTKRAKYHQQRRLLASPAKEGQ